MTGNSPQAIYYAMGVLLLLSSLLATRLPLGKALRMGLAWVGIFAAFFVLFAFRLTSRTGLCTSVTASTRTVTAYSSGTGTDAAESGLVQSFAGLRLMRGRFVQHRRKFLLRTGQ